MGSSSPPPSPLFSTRIFYRLVPLSARHDEGLDGRYPWHIADSFVLNFMKLFQAQMRGIQTFPRDTGGVPRLVPANNNALNCEAAVSDDDYGLIIGDGTTWETVDTYRMFAKITEGTGEHRCLYGATTISAPSEEAYDSKFVIERTLRNNIPIDLTVSEMGLFSQHGTDEFCLVYDGIVQPVIIPGLSTSIGQYWFQTQTPWYVA